MAGKSKNPKFGAKPRPTKKPKIAENLLSDGHPLAWRFGQSDRGGPFPWLSSSSDEFPEVFEKLVAFEDKNWNEIERGGSHSIPTDQLAKKAKERLVEIERDDLDELLSLRLSGTNRVWCFKAGHILRPLWWDPDHQVYPVKKDKKDRKKDRKKSGG